MQLNIVLRGQSNASLLLTDGAASAIQTQVANYLGFSGTSNTINLIATEYQPNGNNTINSGTSFLTQWLTAVNGNWQNGWTNKTLETGFINELNSLPAAEKAAPTAILFVHNEYDSANPLVTPAEFQSAVQYEATQVRSVLGQTAATTPYMFVDIPYGEGTDTGNQAIKQAEQTLAATAGFNGAIAARANDLDMNWNLPVSQIMAYYGDGHMSPADASSLVVRVARSIADQFSQYALPGSPEALAGGHLANTGPQVVTAQAVTGAANELLVSIALDSGAALKPLSIDAAAGVGWSVVDNGVVTVATGAALEANGTQILLTFQGAVAVDGTDAVYYGYGIGRTAQPATAAAPNGYPAEGNAVYDSNGLPIWASAYGVTIAGTVVAATPPIVPPPTPPGAIAVTNPGTLAETAPGSGGTYTASISAPGLAQVYASVFNASNAQQTNWTPVPLNGYGAASLLTQIPQTGDYVNLTNNPSNPTIDGASLQATVTDPAASTGLQSSADTFVLYLTAAAVQGTPHFVLTLDGAQLGPAYTVTAPYNAGQGTPQQFAFSGPWGSQAHTLGIDFVSDTGALGGASPSLYLSALDYNGVAISSGDAIALGHSLTLSFT